MPDIKKQARDDFARAQKYNYSHKVNPKLLPDAKILNEYIKQHNKLPDSMTSTISSASSDANKELLKAGLIAALALDSNDTKISKSNASMESIKRKLEKSIEKKDALFKQISNPESYMNAGAIYSYVSAREAKIIALVDQQQAAETAALKAYTITPAFKALFADTKAEEVAATSLTDALINTHTDQLNKIKLDSKEKLTAISQDVAFQERNMSYLSRLLSDKDMRLAIEKMHEKSKKPSKDPLAAGQVGNYKSTSLRGDFEEFELTRTLSGRRIKKTIQTIQVDVEVEENGKKVTKKQPQEVEVYRIDLPNMCNPWFMLKAISGGMDQWKKEAWRDVIGKIRADGHTKLNLFMDNDKNPKRAKQDVMIQIAAALECGYKIDDISFKINGTAISKEDIFADNPSKLALIIKEEKSYEEAWQAEKKKASGEESKSFDHLKEHLKENRARVGREEDPEPLAPESVKNTGPKK